MVFESHRTKPARLNVGWEEVALGPKHGLGLVDAPVAITPSHFIANTQPAGDGNSLGHSDAEVAAFVSGTLLPALRASPPPLPGEPRQVLIFIHGYNNSFNDAVRKTAQLGGDLELVDCEGRPRGVMVAYSWPAKGGVLGYLADEESAEWTQQRLVPFLRAVAAMCRQEHAELQLIAHSMGSRALVRSLAEMANMGGGGSGTGPVCQVILLAPDMEKSLFEQYLQRALPLVKHVTIYVSAKDRVLSLSQILHGGHSRLGLLESTVLAPFKLAGLGDNHREIGYSALAESGKLDMIDVSNGMAAEFGHSYDDPAFIRDLRELIYHEVPAGTGARSNLQLRETRGDLFHNLAGEKIRYFQLGPRSSAD